MQLRYISTLLPLLIATVYSAKNPCPDPRDPGCCLQKVKVVNKNGVEVERPLGYDPKLDQCTWPEGYPSELASASVPVLTITRVYTATFNEPSPTQAPTIENTINPPPAIATVATFVTAEPPTTSTISDIPLETTTPTITDLGIAALPSSNTSSYTPTTTTKLTIPIVNATVLPTATGNYTIPNSTVELGPSKTTLLVSVSGTIVEFDESEMPSVSGAFDDNLLNDTVYWMFLISIVLLLLV